MRAFELADGKALADLHRKSILATSTSFYTEAELQSWAAGLGDPGFYAPRDGGVTEVAVAPNGEVVAFCQSTNEEVLGLYVHPDHQRLGAGTALMNRAEARISGAGRTLARVHASISSAPFYERRGYRIVEQSSHQTRGGMVLRSTRLERSLA